MIARAGAAPLALALFAALGAMFAGGCGSPRQQAGAQAPPAAVSPAPGSWQNRTLADALVSAAGFLAGQSSTNLNAQHVQSVEYVQTSLAQAATLLGADLLQREVGVAPATVAWLFAARGDYAERSRFDASTPAPRPGTYWVLAIQGGGQAQGAATGPLDISLLGPPIVVEPGQSAMIDQVRGPMALTLGAPSLVGGAVQVPVVAANPYKATLVPYRALNVHVRWDPAAFSYAGVSSAGSVLPAPSCVRAISHDADGGGVVLGCGAVGGSTAATGLLATVLLTAKAGRGCSRVHLVTYGGADGGDATSGTYAVNAFSGQPLPAEYGDANVNASGGAC